MTEYVPHLRPEPNPNSNTDTNGADIAYSIDQYLTIDEATLMLSKHSPDTKTIKEKLRYAVRENKINYRRRGNGVRAPIEISTYEIERYMEETLKGNEPDPNLTQTQNQTLESLRETIETLKGTVRVLEDELKDKREREKDLLAIIKKAQENIETTQKLLKEEKAEKQLFLMSQQSKRGWWLRLFGGRE